MQLNQYANAEANKVAALNPSLFLNFRLGLTNYFDTKFHEVDSAEDLEYINTLIIVDEHFGPHVSIWKENKFINKLNKLNIRTLVFNFEKIFLELGVDVLSNVDNYLAVNPKESVKELRKDIQNVIKQIKNSKDLDVLKKLEYQLKRIQDIGGFDKLVPSEGIVFTYKGKTYKLTGLFAPVNQLLGLTKYV